MNLSRKEIPAESLLSSGSFDYVDCYSEKMNPSQRNRNSSEFGKAFFTSAPKWTAVLFELRNKIVAVFGLKTSKAPKNHQKILDQFQCNPGDQLGLFKVYNRNENEVILGEDDKHLDFRISLFKKDRELHIFTVVKYNNSFGKVYFNLIKPFHKAIAPRMLNGILKQL